MYLLGTPRWIIFKYYSTPICVYVIRSIYSLCYSYIWHHYIWHYVTHIAKIKIHRYSILICIFISHKQVVDKKAVFCLSRYKTLSYFFVDSVCLTTRHVKNTHHCANCLFKHTCLAIIIVTKKCTYHLLLLQCVNLTPLKMY